MKKRALAMVFAAFIAMSMAACGGSNQTDLEQEAADSSVVSTENESEPENDTAQTAESTQEPVSAAAIGDYEIEITGAKLCKDYDGNPAISISYKWTNNSNGTTSPGNTVMCTAFQSGVEIDYAVVDFDYNDGWVDARPGKSVDVEMIYTLTGDDPVEFEARIWDENMVEPSEEMVYDTFDISGLDARK